MAMKRVSVILENADGLAWLPRQDHQTIAKPNSCIDFMIDALSMKERAKVIAMLSGNNMVYIRTTENEEVLDVGVDEVLEKEKLLVREVLQKLVEKVEGLNITQLQKKLDDLMENVEGWNAAQLQKKLDDLMENVEGWNATQLQKKLDDLIEKLEKVDVTDVTRVVENLNAREVLKKLVESVQELNATQLQKKLDDLMEKLEKVDVIDVTQVVENLNGIEEGGGGGIDIKKYIILFTIAFAGYALGRCGNNVSFGVGYQFLAAVDLKAVKDFFKPAAIKDFFKPAIQSSFEVFKKEVGRTLLNKLSLS